jgi:hypothetical protein
MAQVSIGRQKRQTRVTGSKINDGAVSGLCGVSVAQWCFCDTHVQANLN